MSAGPSTAAAAITGRTAIFALLADPVEHVGSPPLFNAYLSQSGLDGVLVPLQVPADALATVVTALRRMGNLRGFLVTIPHKQAILPLLNQLTPEAERAGAVNVVRRMPDGSLIGGQLDGDAFVAALLEAGETVTGSRVFIAGAGGVACGIGSALAEHGAAAITIFNRSQPRALNLIERLQHGFPACDVRMGGPNPAGHDIVVNATNLGQRPADALPLDVHGLDGTIIAAEVVIEPDDTAFLRAAMARGCRVQRGAAMVRAQLPLMLAFMAPRS
ncbi:shikimate dehydrogenase family protein [Azospirillum melinis]|uniref:shikimate dehydrogenase family protein n=1 Tax=Azospirillum melinis TaxID=328839 RepID=UPI00375820AF